MVVQPNSLSLSRDSPVTAWAALALDACPLQSSMQNPNTTFSGSLLNMSLDRSEYNVAIAYAPAPELAKPSATTRVIPL